MRATWESSIMMPIEPALAALEWLRFHGSRLRGVGTFGPVRRYFDPGEGNARSPTYLARLDALNETFERWIAPRETGAPPRGSVRHDGELISFPSSRPIGDPNVDRVVVRLYPAPQGAPDVGVLFHHWVYAESWRSLDLLLAPLAERFRVAVMVAPHHMMRRRAGFGPGEGMVNPNPRHLFEALAQWQADHAAVRALLLRDFGFRRLVMAGYSLGGYSLLLARLDGLADPTVAICTTNCYYRGVRFGSSTRRLAVALREAGFTWRSFRRATRALHLARYAERIGGEQLTWIRARRDRIEPAESLAEPLERLAPERVVTLPGGHATAALFRRRIAREIALRVERLAERSGARRAGALDRAEAGA